MTWGCVVVHVRLRSIEYWLVIWLSYTPQWGQIKLIFLHCCDTLNICCVPNKNALCLIHIQRYRQTILSTHELCRHRHDPRMNLNRVIVIHLSLGNCLRWEKHSTQRSYKIEQIQTHLLDCLKITNVVYRNHYTTPIMFNYAIHPRDITKSQMMILVVAVITAITSKST